MRITKRILAIVVAAALAPEARAAVVYANSPPPGDAYTNASGTNQGQAVGATGWYYNNVRGSGVVGINTALPQSGNGSVFFTSPSGAAKADIEFLSGGTNVGGNFFASTSLGSFSALSGMSYDWYRVGTSTNPAVQHPSLRVLLDADGNLNTLGDRGYLIFEGAYNGQPTAPTDTWVTNNVGSSTNLWNSNSTGIWGPQVFNQTLAQWQAQLPSAAILGFNSGVGSGWNGAFSGAVDNVAWTLGGTTTTNNFEVAGGATQIPEPATLAVFGVGLLGLAARARRRSA